MRPPINLPDPCPPVRLHKLLDGKGLLACLFDEESRPSLRWLHAMQAQRRIPYIKMGHLVRYDPVEVRAALAEQWTVRPRKMNRR